MEPVPETERMEEFRSSPLPTMRLQGSSPFTFASPTPLPPHVSTDPESNLRKPPNLRRSTEPPSPSSPSWAPSPAALPYRPRTASPLSGSHMRSRSTASVGSLYPPAMGRTRSMPGVNGAGHLQFFTDPRTSSPTLGHRPPALTMRTPKKSLVEDVFPSSPTRVSVIHDSDSLGLPERSSSPSLGIQTPLQTIPADSTLNTSITSQPLARTRRPSSPYRRLSSSSGGSASSSLTPTPHTASAPSLTSTTSSSSITSTTSTTSTTSVASAYSTSSANSITPTATNATPDISVSSQAPAVPVASVTVTPPSSAASSPLYRPSDTLLSAPSYSSLGGLSSSSVPSTPTSTRSRSPSISSLETIPDSPDAEEAALEAERMAQLKAAADAVDGDGKGGRGSLDVPTRGRTLSFGSRDKRKRWSVCGAERRGDLDLETIWED